MNSYWRILCTLYGYYRPLAFGGGALEQIGRFFGWVGRGLVAGVKAVYNVLGVLSTVGGAIALILWILTLVLHWR